MKASDMYDQSLTASQRLPPKSPLPTRLLGALRGAGFVLEEKGKQPRLKTDQLRKAILDGTIWGVRNIGVTYVRLLCEWLEQKDASDAPPESETK